MPHFALIALIIGVYSNPVHSPLEFTDVESRRKGWPAGNMTFVCPASRLQSAEQASPIQTDKTKVLTRIETHRLAIVACSKCLHIVKLLMFSVVLAKLLPERHNLYGNSLDFKLNIYKKK